MVRIKLLDKIFKDNNNSGGSSTGRENNGATSSSSRSSRLSARPNKSRLLSHDAHSMANTSGGSREDIISNASSSSSSNETNNNSLLFSSILNENFICNCCLELFKNPVTLMCGHSFCQLCLADWFLISSNRRCPICRQEWVGVPKQNQALKATIRRLVKYDSSNYLTYNDKLTKEEERKLKTFHQKCTSASQYQSTGSGVAAFMGSAVGVTIGTGTPMNTTNNNNNAEYINQQRIVDSSLRALMNQRSVDSLYNFFAGLFTGVLLATIAFTLVWVLFGIGGGSSGSSSTNKYSGSSFMSSSSSYLSSTSSSSTAALTAHNGVALLRRKFSKPIEFWTCVDIQEWLFALGPWTNKIASAANVLKIDGPKLLQLNETNLKEPPFDVKEDEFRKLLIDSIRVLKGCHFKPINFWEIKNNNRFELLIFSLFFESFPRLTFLYYYVLDTDHHVLQLTRLSQMNIADLHENDYLYIENVKKGLLFKERIEMSPRDKLLYNREISSFKTVSYFLKLPYMRFKNVFSLFFYESNKFVTVFLAIRCVLLTLVDLVFLLDFFRSLIGFDTDRLRLIFKVSMFTYLKSISFISFLYIFWNLIPNLFIDAIFVYAFFLRIVFNMDSFVNNFKNFLGSIGHYFIRPNH